MAVRTALVLNADGEITELPTNDSLSGPKKPTVTNWGANTETLAADKVLTDADAAVQFLNPGGVDRNVDLPTPSTSSPFFVIFNAPGGGDLLVRDAGFDIIRVPPNRIARLYTDGTTWTEQKAGAATSEVTLGWGSIPSATRLFRAWGTASTSVGSTTFDANAEHTCPVAGFLSRISWSIDRGTSPSEDTEIEIMKNGAVAETVRFSVERGESFVLSTAVVRGDELAVRAKAGELSGTAASFTIAIASTEGTVFGGCYGWGGSQLESPGSSLATAWGRADLITQPFALDFETELTIHSAGALKRLSWNTNAGDSTTQFEIMKNGAASETVTLTGATGSLDLTTSVAAGDEIGIRFKGGTIPGDSNFNIVVDSAGFILAWAGNMAASKRPETWADINEVTGTTSVPDIQEHTVPFTTGAGASLAVLSEAAPRVFLLKNGIKSEDTGALAFGGAVVAVGTTFVEGDTVSIIEGANAGKTSYGLKLTREVVPA